MTGSPRLPDPVRMPTPQQRPQSGLPGGLMGGFASAFRSFGFAPQLAGLAPRRAGRRSLIGGS